jgi:hypothetical protein
MKICSAVLELLDTSRKTDVTKPVRAIFATFDLTAINDKPLKSDMLNVVRRYAVHT